MRRIVFDSGTPTARSIGRVVLVAMVISGLAALAGFMVYWLQHLILLLILSVFFGYLIDPLVRLIRRPFKERNKESFMPRSLAIVLAYLLVFAALALSISYLAPRISEQFKEFAGKFPEYSQSVRTRVNDLNERYKSYPIPDEVRENIKEKTQGVIEDATASIATGVGSLFIGLVPFLPWIVLMPLLAFFFLKDIHAFKASILRMFPAGQWRYRAEVFLHDMNRTLAAYTRAQLISCVLIGVVCTLAFYLLDVPYALLLGVLAGILEFIPLAGPFVIGVIAVSIAAFYSPWQAGYVATFLIILRLVHDYVTYPRIVREGIHLHPLAIILAILAGGEVAGIIGIFLSIPVVAILAVVYKHILEIAGRSTLIGTLLDEDDSEVPEQQQVETT